MVSATVVLVMEGDRRSGLSRNDNRFELGSNSDSNSIFILDNNDGESLVSGSGILKSKSRSSSSKHGSHRTRVRSPSKRHNLPDGRACYVAEYVKSEITARKDNFSGFTETDNETEELCGLSDGEVSAEIKQERDTTDSDYDTDLEMDHRQWVYPEKYEHDTTGQAKYVRACEEEGVQPVRTFLRSMHEDHLNLRHHSLGPKAIKALATPLESNTTIEAMDLEGNWVMAEGVLHLCRVLKENVYVTRLNLAENQIGNEGAITVCNLLISNRHIDHLNLSGNTIGNPITEKLCEVLTQTGATLKHLDLSHNKLDDTSAQRIKEALVDNECLAWLDLSWNHFQSKGCVLIAEGLKENVGLKELTVSMNGFGLEGGKALGRALQANRTLLRLGANFCRLPTDCMGEIALGMANNDTLQIMELGYNCLDADGALVLIAGIQRNDSSKLMFLELGNTRVSHKFKEIQDELSEKRGLAVHHGGVKEDYKILVFEVDPMEAFKRNPMSKLKEWLAHAGYRLIDLLRQFDKDNSWSISIAEFKQGIASTGIPLTDDQVNYLVRDLDKDGDGEIDFSELVEGDKVHRETKRELLKIITKREEEAKEREQREKDKLLPTPSD